MERNPVRRNFWNLIPALLIPFLLGLGLGLAYSWLISPVRVIDAEPIALRADFKDQYRSAIAGAFAGTGNLARARARLTLLGDTDSVAALNAQAQRLLSEGDPAGADQVAALAAALQSGEVVEIPSPIASEVVINSTLGPTRTAPASPTEFPLIITDTPELLQSPIVVESTPRPTRTPIPTAGAAFALTGQEAICDTNLPDGLLQVLVLNANRRQMPGMEIRITWDGGSEEFFTGLKPELGNGYADFIMTPDIVYSLQLGAGSDVASGISAPACQTDDGNSYSGGIKLTFQQPD
jgi:hypothetical protein